jgi:predicted P-loop ATPase/GTPase
MLYHMLRKFLCVGGFSLKDKMRIWEQYNRLKRAEEQVDKVKQDAHAMVKYYTQLADRLQAAAPVHISWLGKHADDADVQAGLRALMAAGGQHVGQQLVQSQQLVARIS